MTVPTTQQWEAEERRREAAELAERAAADDEKQRVEEREAAQLATLEPHPERRPGEQPEDHSRRIDKLADRHGFARLRRRAGETEASHSERIDGHFRLADDDRTDAEIERENADLRAAIAALQTTLRPREPGEDEALAQAQARADSVMALFNDRAPPPNVGETPLSYRRRLLRPLLKHSRHLAADARLDAFDSAGLGVIEDRVFADARAAADREVSRRPGLLIARTVRDASGRETTTYDGDFLAWFDPFRADGARVTLHPPRHATPVRPVD
jgi:hypothetical protein